MKTSRFMVLFAAAAMAGAAFADDGTSYLYVMADETIYYGEGAGSALSTHEVSYDYAKVNAGGSYLSFYDTEGTALAVNLPKGEDGAVGFDSSAAPSSFIFELYNYDDVKVGWSALAYSQAFQNNYIYSDPSDTTDKGIYHINQGQVVPEPSSALLLLLGMAGLGLKRRRA